MRAAWVAVVAFATYLGTWTPAHACSCAPTADLATSLAEADLVFLGQALGVSPLPEGKAQVRVAFQVERYWKGKSGTRVDIITAQDGAACGRSFSSGQRYLVFAAQDAELRMTDNLCSRTSTQDLATEDIRALGPPLYPVSDYSASPGGCTMGPQPEGGAKSALLLLLVWRCRRLRWSGRRLLGVKRGRGIKEDPEHRAQEIDRG